ncbi:PLP-dependent transferase, partial [Lacisediminihabitans profunda]
AKANAYAPKGAGAVLSSALTGGVEAGRALVNTVTLFSHLYNIGAVRSLIIHPAPTPHPQPPPEQQLPSGVTPALLRLSLRLETLDDIIADLSAGFAAARTATSSSQIA